MKLRYGLVLFLLLAFTITACKQEATIYRIGAELPLSGSMEAYGRNVKNGLLLALDEINAAGGIKRRGESEGKKIDIVFEDDGTDEKKAVEKTNSLIKASRVPLIIGGVTSSIALEIAPICEKEKVVLLSPTASTPKLSGAGQYIFRNYPSDSLEGKVMAEYAVRRMNVRNVAIFYVNNEYGQGLMNVFKERFTGLGGQIVMEYPYDVGVTDFSAPVKQLKAKPPDAIYVIGYYTEIAAILKEIQKQKIPSKIISVEGLVQPMVLETAADAVEGVIYPQPHYNPESNDPMIQKFVKDYREKFNTKPDIDAAFSYDALRIVAKAIEQSAKYPSDLRDRIADVSMRGIIGDISFDSNGDVDIRPEIFQIKGGKFVPVGK
ncbi:penicillin-binding protein activator [bacterium]|nr:penicillin-binding protein activator [bacterium]